MKLITSFFTILMVCFVAAQNAETNSPNWQVTKLGNQNQLVNNPNEITYGPDGWLWITERAPNSGTGGLRVVRVNPSTAAVTEMIDLSSVAFSNAKQDGLMGLAIHPDLQSNVATTTNNYVYVAYTYGTGNSDRKLRIERLEFDNATKTLSRNSPNPFILIEDIEASNDHNSGRMKIGPDNKIYYTVGDLGWNQFANKCKRIQSQALPSQSEVNNEDWTDYKGKTLRINLDGSIPSDNPTFVPFTPTDAAPGPPDNTVTTGKVRSHIYSFGHRNAQGIIFGSNGKLYSSEHGDRVDDEVNILEAGKNYGWPLSVGEYDDAGYSYCIKASDPNGCATGNNECPTGSIIHEESAFPVPADFQGPIATYNSTVASSPTGTFLTWPTVAPSSIDIYEPQGATDEIPWSTSLLVPTLKKGTIYRYELSADGNSITSDLIEFHSSIDRYRDITISPDGKTIYAITDSSGNTSGPSGTSPQTLQNPGAVIKIEYISLPEPSNQPSSFAATANLNNIDLTWVDATGANPAAGYVITAADDIANLPTLTDGIDVVEDSDLIDGVAVVKVESGQESYTFNGLNQNTRYYFQIHAYSNIGSDIDYLTIPAGPQSDDIIPEFPTLFISEITNTANDDDSNFVEIYNYGELPIDLGARGIYLGREVASSSPVNRYQLALTGIIQPKSTFIIGKPTFNTVYNFNPDQTGGNSLLNGTGDDPYILVYNGTFSSGTFEVIDIYGELGVDGDNEPWNYEDSRMVRNRTAGANSAVWIASQWDIISSTSNTDNSPGELDTVEFVYNNSWAPFDPSGIATSFDNLTVLNGTAPISNDTQIGNLDISAGSTLANGNFVLAISGNVSNLGDLSSTSGSISFNGSQLQTVNGNAFESSTLIIDNDVNLNVDVAINGVLQSQSGNLLINNTNVITLKSNSSSTAFVDQVSGTISGNFTVERFIPAKRAFRFITSSVNTTGSVYDNWQEGGSSASGFGTHITGSTTGTNGFDATISGNLSMFGFNNSTQTWTSITDTDNTNLVAGTPYRILVRGDRGVDLSNNNATATNTTLRMTGALKVGSETITNLSNIAGQFNFVGNPYQAPVDLDKVFAASTNINPNFVYYWDPTVNTRGAYVTVDVPGNSSNLTSNFNKFAQPNSSFFVTTLANGAASMNFEESHKTVNEGTVNIFSAPNNDAFVKIQLFEASEFAQGLRERDAVIMKVNGNYSNTIDALDALKFSNLDESIAIANGGNLLSIERRQFLQDGDEIAINTTNYRSNQYEMVININGILTTAYVHDSYLNNYTALNTNASTVYSFTIDANDPLSMDANRFSIVFSNIALSNDDIALDDSVKVYPNPTSDGVINISGITSDSDIQLFNLLGQQIAIATSSIVDNGNSVRIQLPQSLVKGTYLLNVSNGKSSVSHKIVVE